MQINFNMFLFHFKSLLRVLLIFSAFFRRPEVEKEFSNYWLTFSSQGPAEDGRSGIKGSNWLDFWPDIHWLCRGHTNDKTEVTWLFVVKQKNIPFLFGVSKVWRFNLSKESLNVATFLECDVIPHQGVGQFWTNQW